MIALFRAHRGRFALLVGGLVMGYAAATLRQGTPDFDPWAVN
mgnify:CR=1 FL=1